jgi:endonuclease/exonuclease/phosphatase family metal-dependent hydrolase
MYQLRVLFLNVMMPVPKPLRFIAQEERLHQLATWITHYHSTIDAFIFAELIPLHLEVTLRRTLTSLGFTHYTKQRININVVRSGVVIYSRFPILATNDISYQTECEGSDCLADKNMLYAQLDVHGAHAHLFMTHLHAWPTAFSQSVRTQQLLQLREFITLHQIPPDELILVIGDFNINYHQNQEILTTLHATNIPLTSTQQLTMDAELNPLVGLDNIEYYTNDAYPNGCVKEYWAQHKCVCCPKEWIDYGVLITNAVTPISISQNIIVPDIPEYSIPLGLLHTAWKVKNTVSDHFPVEIFVEWEANQGKRITSKVEMERRLTWNTSYSWTVALCIGVILIWLLLYLVILPRHYNQVCACQRKPLPKEKSDQR